MAIVTIDLANAFGRLRRSRAMKRLKMQVPALFRILAAQWQGNQGVALWRRAQGRWQKDFSSTGGWQGSRLTQVAFAIDHAESMRTWMIGAAHPTAGAPKVMAVADDTYIVGDAAHIADKWDELETELARSGHALRRRKCGAWFM